MQPTERVTLRLPVQDLQLLDTYIRLGMFTSRSEAIRQAIRHLIDTEGSKALEKAQRIQQLQALAAGALKADEALRK